MEDIYRPRKRKREDVMGKENIHPNIMGESFTKGILNTKEIEIESKILDSLERTLQGTRGGGRGSEMVSFNERNSPITRRHLRFALNAVFFSLISILLLYGGAPGGIQEVLSGECDVSLWNSIGVGAFGSGFMNISPWCQTVRGIMTWLNSGPGLAAILSAMMGAWHGGRGILQNIDSMRLRFFEAVEASILGDEQGFIEAASGQSGGKRSKKSRSKSKKSRSKSKKSRSKSKKSRSKSKKSRSKSKKRKTSKKSRRKKR